VISAIHRRFPNSFTPTVVSSLPSALAPPSRASFANLTPEQREKEDSGRILKQRPVLRVSSELALVGIIKDAPDRSGGEWVMKILKDLVGAVLLCASEMLNFLAFGRSVSLFFAPPHNVPQILLPAIPGFSASDNVQAGP
jgi:regulator of nonsense transcripts 2